MDIYGVIAVVVNLMDVWRIYGKIKFMRQFILILVNNSISTVPRRTCIMDDQKREKIEKIK